MDFLIENTVLFAVLNLLFPLGLGLAGLFVYLLYSRGVLSSSQLDLAGRILGFVTVCVCLFLLIMTLLVINAPLHDSVNFSLILQVYDFGTTIDFHVDALSLLFILIINGIAAAVAWNDLAYLGNVHPIGGLQHPIIFHALINLFHLTMLLVVMVDNLVGLWIFIELTTLFSAFLVAYQSGNRSWEAAWKYLIITSTGIILALLGTMFLANAAKGQIAIPGVAAKDSVMNWNNMMALARQDQLDPDFVWLAFLFAVVGYGTKAGLAIMYTWLPDGHGEAPAPISALLSGVLVKAAFFAILRFYTLTNTAFGGTTQTSSVLLFVGVLSLIIAVPFILKENRFKRVLAYHTLEHMGIIVLGLGLGGSVALFGVLLHTLNHAVTKSLMFLAFGNIIRRYEAVGIPQDRITGVLRSMPITGGFLIIGGLALVGTPIFNIFMSEFIILVGAFDRYWDQEIPRLPHLNQWVVIVSIVVFVASTTFIFYGLVRHLGKLTLGRTDGDLRLPEKGLSELLPLAGLTFVVVLLGIWVVPGIANLIHQSVLIILEGS